ncbi:MAG: hypothetical protein V4660_08840 [Pseudomonadota bacterium]
MHTKTIFKIFSTAFISCMLAACGGGTSKNGSALQNAIDGEKNTVTNSQSSNSSSVSSAIGSDTLQSIEFKDAVPSTINLKGTGGAESSLVRFRVLGQTGLPIKDIMVDFVLNTNIGDLALSQTSSKSDANGYVSTSVLSGTISTSVRVTATTTDDPTISTQSNQLVVATGLPDQKSMSLAVEEKNPPGWRYNGIKTTFSILLADAYNNPTADGTAVSFTTEGGSIDPSCTTTGGACTVEWTSHDPKPQRNSSDTSLNRILCIGVIDETLTDDVNEKMLLECEAERAGRITILATAIGNESFKNTNGTGIFNPVADLFKTSSDDKCKPNAPLSSFEASTLACDDLSEAYLDINESKTHEPDEFFVNFVKETTHDASNDNYSANNGIYNGIFCQKTDEANGLCSRQSVTIRKELVIVMSCDYALTDEDGFLPYLYTDTSSARHYALADCNGNSLPVKTKIKIGEAPEVTLGSAIDWLDIIAASGTNIVLTIPIGSDTNTVIRNYKTN